MSRILLLIRRKISLKVLKYPPITLRVNSFCPKGQQVLSSISFVNSHTLPKVRHLILLSDHDLMAVIMQIQHVLLKDGQEVHLVLRHYDLREKFNLPLASHLGDHVKVPLKLLHSFHILLLSLI